MAAKVSELLILTNIIVINSTIIVIIVINIIIIIVVIITTQWVAAKVSELLAARIIFASLCHNINPPRAPDKDLLV